MTKVVVRGSGTVANELSGETMAVRGVRRCRGRFRLQRGQEMGDVVVQIKAGER